MSKINNKPNNNGNAVDKELKIVETLTHNHEGKTLSSILSGSTFAMQMGSGAVLPTINETREVGANMNWINEVARNLLMIADSYQNNIPEGLTEEVVAEYLRWVIANRVNYCENGKNEVHPRSIEYPVMMYDALARITRYDNSAVDGCQIIPTLTAEDKKKWYKDGRVKALKDHDKIVRNMKIAGIEMVAGLPMTRSSSVRTMYEMAVDTNNSVTTAGQAPTITEVFARCFYELEALTELVGMQKVQLILYTTIKNSLYDICERYVINKCNV